MSSKPDMGDGGHRFRLDEPVTLSSEEEGECSTAIQAALDRLSDRFVARTEALLAVVAPNSALDLRDVRAALREAIVEQCRESMNSLDGLRGRVLSRIRRLVAEIGDALDEVASDHFVLDEADSQAYSAESAVVSNHVNRLVRANMSLVHWVARHHSDRFLCHETLSQEGAIALRKAALRFRDDGTARFSTFATTVVNNHLHDVRRSAHNVSDTAERRIEEFRRSEELLSHELGYAPSTELVFDYLGWNETTRSTVSNAMRVANPECLETARGDPRYRQPVDPSNVVELVAEREVRQRVHDALAELSSEERRVIVAHDFRGESLRSIAKADGVSDQRIRRLRRTALEKLGSRLASKDASHETASQHAIGGRSGTA